MAFRFKFSKIYFPLPNLFAGLLILLCQVAQAQGPDMAYFRKTYPQESFVFLNKVADVKMEIRSGALSVIQHHHEELLILNSNHNTVRKRKIRNSSFIRVMHVQASMQVWDGKGYKKQKLRNIELRSEHNSSDIFYGDDQFYYVNFPEAKEGDIVSIDYDEEYREHRFFGMFFLSDYSPVIKASYSVTYPTNGLQLNIKTFDNQQLGIRTRKDSTKRSTTLSWSLDSIVPLKEEYLEPAFKYKASYILMAIKNYQLKDSTVEVSGTLENLYAWYSHLVKDVDVNVNDDLKKLTDSLTQGETNELGKLKNIYYWVQSKIAYLAYEDGLGGYIPRQAPVVCKQRFGDCKDMANLIVQMSKIAGLPVYPTWIGTRDIPYDFSDFPAPFCANHLIATYISKQDTIFLDATGKNYPFGLPTSMIQGKQGLIGISKDSFLLARVPWLPAESTVEHDSVNISIQPDRQIKGNGIYSLTGYEKIHMVNLLEKKSYDSQKEILKGVLEKGNNKFRLDTFYVVQKNTKDPLLLAYQFSIRDYVSEDKNHLFLNLNFLSDYFDRLSIGKRQTPIHFYYRSVNRLTVQLQLPETYAVDFIPDSGKEANTVARFTKTFAGSSKAVEFRNEIRIDEPIIDGGNLKTFDHIISNYKKNKSGVVSLINTPKK